MGGATQQEYFAWGGKWEGAREQTKVRGKGPLLRPGRYGAIDHAAQSDDVGGWIRLSRLLRSAKQSRLGGAVVLDFGLAGLQNRLFAAGHGSVGLCLASVFLADLGGRKTEVEGRKGQDGNAIFHLWLPPSLTPGNAIESI